MEQARTDGSQASTGESTLLSEAAHFFYLKLYDRCQEVLKKLLEINPKDTKVQMNKLLLDYVHKYGYTHTGEFLNELARLMSVEATLPGTDSVDNVTVADGRGNGTSSSSPSHLQTSPKPSLPHSPLLISLQYNYALTLYYLRQYVKAERVLSGCLGLVPSITSALHLDRDFSGSRDPSFTESASDPSLLSTINLMPSTDITLCRRLLLLWLEVLLQLQQPDRVFRLCGTWLMVLSSMSLASTLNSANPQIAEQFPFSIGSSGRFQNAQIASVLLGIRKPIQLFYIRACLLTNQLEAAENELHQVQTVATGPEAATTASSEPCNGSSVGETISTDREKSDSILYDPEEQHPATIWDTGHAVHFLQAQLAYLKPATVFSPRPQVGSMHVGYYIVLLYLSKGRYSEALRYLSDIPPPVHSASETGQCESTLLWNDLGLVHHRAGQYNLSGLQLRRALRETDKTIRDVFPTHLRSSKSNTSSHPHHGKTGNQSAANERNLLDQLPLHTFSLSQHHALLYNFGLQLLFARKPTAAFSAFLQLTNTYPRNPRLWFRLAECCIKTHRPNNLFCWQLETRTRCLVEAVGVGPCRHLIFSSGHQEASKPWIEAASMPAPTLEFASLCLRNALLLLPRLPAEITCRTDGPSLSAEQELRTALLKWAARQEVPVLPAPAPLRGAGLLHLLSAIYLATTYTALCLNNPVEALHSASKLISNRGNNNFDVSGDLRTNSNEDADSTVSTQVPASNHNSTVLGLIAPTAYCLLARLYFAEALTNLDRVSEAITLLKSSLPESSLRGDQFAQFQASAPSLASVHLRPNLSSDDFTVECQRANDPDSAQCHKSSITDHLTIYPPDFPSTSSQASSLLLYTLVVTLAIDKQWTVAANLLSLSLPGLSIPVEELDGRRRTPPAAGDALTSTHPTILPTPAILLQLYLSSVLNKPEQTLSILREHFGHFTLAGRLNSHPLNRVTKFVSSSSSFGVTTSPSTQKQPSTTEVERSLALKDLRQLLQASSTHGQLTARSSGQTGNVQRPSNLWAPTIYYKQQQAAASYVSPSLYNQTTPQSQSASYSTTNPPVQQPPTGVITAANESDWPRL
ncbi:CCR4-NOT transcription complex subunit 10-B [Paragonimus westermani]|uniref:CCR4-NOT transcription complex subunit 10 n=1 Tax=Paragonimus westermani TaxID=34504 RepID=A0A8T0D1A1_9TREM|nr:CCR4-NOT transcription complex subunit 10-B [Paragonimus westermani]